MKLIDAVVLLLLFIFPFNHGLGVKKCCLDGQLLDAETLLCVPNTLPPERMTHFLPSYMINMTSEDLMTMQSKVHKNIQSGHMPQCQRSYELLDLTKPLEYLISTDGKLVSLAGKFSPLLDLGDFCIETAFLRSQLTFRSALICDPCSQRKCIQSCCSHLQMAKFDQSNNQLVCQNPHAGGSRSKFKFVPPGIPEKLGNFTLVKSDHREYAANCEVQNGTLVNTRDYHVSEDGSRVHVGSNSSVDFCVGFTEMSSDGTIWTQASVELCVTPDEAAKLRLYTQTYPICCTISNFFLLLTFLCYVFMPDLRGPLFGKIIMIFIFCLFLAYASISVVSFGHSRLVNDRPSELDYSPICRILGFVVQFTYLQAFFWMNVLCYDIFRAFRKIRLTSVASKERDDIRKLLFYTMYASGAPMIIIILSVVVEYQPQTYAGPRPQFGVERCFFGSDVGSFIFFHLPLMIIQTTNLVFFILTTKKLFETWKLTKLESSEYRVSPRTQRNSNNFKIIFKMFIIMGITWFSELFGFVLSWMYGRDRVWKYFVFNDIINLSQGVLIFIVLICKPSVLNRIFPLMLPKKKISVITNESVIQSKSNTK